MYRVATSLLFLLLSFSLHPYADQGTYCDDPTVWADWHEKATKHVGNLDFQMLHALWIGLCTKVGNGTLTEDDAEALFARARATLLQSRGENTGLPSAPTF